MVATSRSTVTATGPACVLSPPVAAAATRRMPIASDIPGGAAHRAPAVSPSGDRLVLPRDDPSGSPAPLSLLASTRRETAAPCRMHYERRSPPAAANVGEMLATPVGGDAALCGASRLLREDAGSSGRLVPGVADGTRVGDGTVPGLIVPARPAPSTRSSGGTPLARHGPTMLAWPPHGPSP